MNCGSCGCEVQNVDKFCETCGSSLATSDTKSEEQTRPPKEQAIRNELATPALVLGILSALFFEFFPVPLAALVTGLFALTRSTELQNLGSKKTGKGKSIAGVSLGALYLVVWFAYFTGIYR